MFFHNDLPYILLVFLFEFVLDQIPLMLHNLIIICIIPCRLELHMWPNFTHHYILL